MLLYNGYIICYIEFIYIFYFDLDIYCILVFIVVVKIFLIFDCEK